MKCGCISETKESPI